MDSLPKFEVGDKIRIKDEWIGFFFERSGFRAPEYCVVAEVRIQGHKFYYRLENYVTKSVCYELPGFWPEDWLAKIEEDVFVCISEDDIVNILDEGK